MFIIRNLPWQLSSTKHPLASLPPCTLSSRSLHATGHTSGQFNPLASCFRSTQSADPLQPLLSNNPWQKYSPSAQIGGQSSGHRFPSRSFLGHPGEWDVLAQVSPTSAILPRGLQIGMPCQFQKRLASVWELTGNECAYYCIPLHCQKLRPNQILAG